MPPANIQWFPGHMHKARKEIGKRLASVDLVIEVLDARLPFSSQNPMLAELRQVQPGAAKPCIKLLNKIDLADPDITQQWLDFFVAKATTTPLASNAKDATMATTITRTAKYLVPQAKGRIQGIQALIVGIPNVGKSTVINNMTGRSIAKTGNEPAVTKLQQRIDTGSGIVLFDTPGVLWPNVENRNSGLRLGVTGAIKNTAINYPELAEFALEYLGKAYPQVLRQRYKLDPHALDNHLLAAIGRQRGCIQRGGAVDFDRAAKIIVNDIRTGRLGKISMETPAMMIAEQCQLEILRADKAAKKAERAANKKTNKR